MSKINEVIANLETEMNSEFRFYADHDIESDDPYGYEDDHFNEIVGVLKDNGDMLLIHWGGVKHEQYMRLFDYVDIALTDDQLKKLLNRFGSIDGHCWPIETHGYASWKQLDKKYNAEHTLGYYLSVLLEQPHTIGRVEADAKLAEWGKTRYVGLDKFCKERIQDVVIKNYKFSLEFCGVSYAGGHTIVHARLFSVDSLLAANCHWNLKYESPVVVCKNKKTRDGRHVKFLGKHPAALAVKEKMINMVIALVDYNKEDKLMN